MHDLDVSKTFQNLSHLNPTRRCGGNLCPRILGESRCRSLVVAWVDAWLLVPCYHDYDDDEEPDDDDEEAPDEDDEDDKGGGLGESRCRSWVLA